MDLEILTQRLNPKDHSRFQVVKYFIQELKKRTPSLTFPMPNVEIKGEIENVTAHRSIKEKKNK